MSFTVTKFIKILSCWQMSQMSHINQHFRFQLQLCHHASDMMRYPNKAGAWALNLR